MNFLYICWFNNINHLQLLSSHSVPYILSYHPHILAFCVPDKSHVVGSCSCITPVKLSSFQEKVFPIFSKPAGNLVFADAGVARVLHSRKRPSAFERRRWKNSSKPAFLHLFWTSKGTCWALFRMDLFSKLFRRVRDFLWLYVWDFEWQSNISPDKAGVMLLGEWSVLWLFTLC